MKQIRLMIKDMLAEKGMTRYELSKRTGLAYPIVDHYYKNRVSRYDRETLLKICLALDCDVSDILKITESEE